MQGSPLVAVHPKRLCINRIADAKCACKIMQCSHAGLRACCSQLCSAKESFQLFPHACHPAQSVFFKCFWEKVHYCPKCFLISGLVKDRHQNMQWTVALAGLALWDHETDTLKPGRSEIICVAPEKWLEIFEQHSVLAYKVRIPSLNFSQFFVLTHSDSHSVLLRHRLV